MEQYRPRRGERPNLTQINLGSGETLSLVGDATSTFIINIDKDFVLNSGHIALLGGVTANNVLFNMLTNVDGGDVSKNVQQSGAAIGSGTILALDRNVTIDGAAGQERTGHLFSSFSSTIHVFSDATIIQPDFTLPTAGTPEPSTVALPIGALLVLFAMRRRQLFAPAPLPA